MTRNSIGTESTSTGIVMFKVLEIAISYTYPASVPPDNCHASRLFISPAVSKDRWRSMYEILA